MIEAGLYNLLSTTAGITAIVGANIFPDVLPRNPTYPGMTYTVVGAKQDPTFTTRGTQRVRVEIVCESMQALQAEQLRNAVDAALNGYQGTLSDGTVIQNAERIGVMPGYDHDALVYRRMIEFYMYFN